MPSFYSAFGFSLCANRPVPGLMPRPRPFPAWTHRSGSIPRLAGCRLTIPRRTLARRKEADERHTGVAGVEARGGRRVQASVLRRPRIRRRSPWNGSVGPVAWLVDDRGCGDLPPRPVLGFVLRLRGTTCLHASAVTIGGSAIALLGPPNAGKSTTAASLRGSGYPVIADDIVALVERDGGLCVQPAYPQLRLWPESVALLYGTADALPPLTPNWDKRALDLTRRRLSLRGAAAIPLGDLCPGGTRAGGRTHARGIEALHSRKGLLTLLANTYVGYLLDGRDARAGVRDAGPGGVQRAGAADRVGGRP